MTTVDVIVMTGDETTWLSQTRNEEEDDNNDDGFLSPRSGLPVATTIHRTGEYCGLGQCLQSIGPRTTNHSHRCCCAVILTKANWDIAMSNKGENKKLSLARDEETTLSEKPRQWIYDRSNGQSKDSDSRPPCALCWPPPCLICMPDFFEQNCFCENMGKIGVVDGDESGNSKRTLLMGIGLFSNVIGLIFAVEACFGMSSNFAFLEAVPYTMITASSENSLFDSVTMTVGLVALAVWNPPNHTLTELVVHADEYCDYTGLRFRSFVSLEDCETRTAVSTGLVAALISSVASYIPAIGTNVLRMYPHYDVNCQKVFGILATFFGLAGAAVTWRGYNHDCVSAFTVGTVAFDPLGNPVNVDSPDAFVHLDLNPQPGLGLIMIVTATILKVVNIVVHLALPTPSITRSHKLQLEYEKRR